MLNFKIILIISLAISVLNEINCLKSSEVCLINPNIINPICLDEHNYKCTENYCAANQSACTDFIAFNSYLSTIKSYRLKTNLKFLVKSIKKCARNSYTWNENDVCLNTFTCFKKHVINHAKSGMVLSIRKQSYCTCPKKLSFECQSQYCSLNEVACLEFGKHLANESANKINKCKLNINISTVKPC